MRQWHGSTVCPLLFAGQYADGESGSAYNRFRYYSPDLGVYGAQDPLGLSPNLGWAQGYVAHPGFMVDLLGLMGGKAHQGAAGRRAVQQEKLDGINRANQVINGEIPKGHKLNPHELELSRSQHPETTQTFDRAMNQGQPDLLQRTGPDLRNRNRAIATKGWGKNSGSPDEYPFASTVQGGGQATVLGVSNAFRRSQGGTLSRFYDTNNIQIGDWFHVKVVD